jgi:hypothetical protein
MLLLLPKIQSISNAFSFVPYPLYIGRLNDVWRSIDKGSSWSLVTSSAPWSGRYAHSSVALDSNTIILMGGDYNGGKLFPYLFLYIYFHLSLCPPLNERRRRNREISKERKE